MTIKPIYLIFLAFGLASATILCAVLVFGIYMDWFHSLPSGMRGLLLPMLTLSTGVLALLGAYFRRRASNKAQDEI
jgi:hypothetical protein